MQRFSVSLSLSFLSVALFTVFAVGCGGSDADETARGTSTGPNRGGTFRLNVLRGDPNGLDPVLVDSKHADDIASQIFDKLLDLDDSLNLVPELATALPEISEDGKTYTFHLRNDVFFHDDPCFPNGKGRRVTAEDIKYSLTRCCDPRQLTKADWAFKGKVVGAREFYDAAIARKPIDEVKGFQAIDDSTFRIELIEPYAPFIYVLVNSFSSAVPREGVEKYGKDFARHPVGSGAFKFVRWAELEDVLLTRNPNYWEKDREGNPLPYLDSLRFRFIKSEETQFNAFLNGELDECFNIPSAAFDAVFDPATLKPRADFEEYVTQAEPAMLTWYFAFNNRKAPFDDVNVRQAFNYAVDRERIVRFVLQNAPHGAATHGLVPPVFRNYPVDQITGYDLNTELAAEKLAAAGYPNGEGFPEIEMYIYDEPRLMQVAEALQAQLTTGLNIKVSIRSLAFPQFIELSESGKIGFWGTRWYGDYPDPETYLNLLNGQLVPDDPNAPSNPNGSRYNSQEFNELFNKAVGTIDNVARLKYYAQAEQVAMDDAPVMPLFYERHFRLLQPWVHGLKLNAMAKYDFKRVWIDRGGASEEKTGDRPV